MLPSLVVVVILAAVLGFLFFLQQDAYVVTDNAHVTGNLIQVGATSAAQVRSVAVDVGDRVERNQAVASVIGPGGQIMSLRSTLDGIVLARYANPGDAVTAGRPILSVLDPYDLWVQAQIDEGQVGRVRPGQMVEVSVEALGRTVPGRVVSVGGASAAALAQGQSQPAGALRARQTVPVKIGVDPEAGQLLYGGQAFVKIAVR
jgi:multidrug resistance efflux pump